MFLLPHTQVVHTRIRGQYQHRILSVVTSFPVPLFLTVAAKFSSANVPGLRMLLFTDVLFHCSYNYTCHLLAFSVHYQHPFQSDRTSFMRMDFHTSSTAQELNQTQANDQVSLRNCLLSIDLNVIRPSISIITSDLLGNQDTRSGLHLWLVSWATRQASEKIFQ